MKPIPFRKLGDVGVLTDIPATDVPHNGFTDANNVVFRDSKASKLRGFELISDLSPYLGVGEEPLKFQYGWDGASPVLFVATTAKIWKYFSGTWSDVTRFSGGYSTTAWDSLLFGQYVIFTSTSDIPQVFDSVTGLFIDLPNWPATLRCERIRAYGSFLFALGLLDTAVAIPYTYVWSHPADVNSLPSSWDYASPSTRAGIADVPGATGVIVDGGELGSSFIMYTTHACYEIRLAGGKDVMSRRKIHSRGLLNARGFVAYDDFHFVVGNDSIYIHSAGLPNPIGESKVNKRIYGSLTTERKIFVAHDPKNSEIRGFIQQPPKASPTDPDFATPFFIWNYSNGGRFTFGSVPDEVIDAGQFPIPPAGLTWEDLAVAGTTWAELGKTWAELDGSISGFRLLWLKSSAEIYQESTDFNVATVLGQSAFLERVALDFDEVAPRPIGDYLFISQLVPQIEGTGTVYFQFGRMDSVNKGVTWDAPIAYNLDGTDDEVTFMVETTHFCYRVYSDSTGYWDFSGFDLYAQPSGEQ